MRRYQGARHIPPYDRAGFQRGTLSSQLTGTGFQRYSQSGNSHNLSGGLTHDGAGRRQKKPSGPITLVSHYPTQPEVVTQDSGIRVISSGAGSVRYGGIGASAAALLLCLHGSLYGGGLFDGNEHGEALMDTIRSGSAPSARIVGTAAGRRRRVRKPSSGSGFSGYSGRVRAKLRDAAHSAGEIVVVPAQRLKSQGQNIKGDYDGSGKLVGTVKLPGRMVGGVLKAVNGAALHIPITLLDSLEAGVNILIPTGNGLEGLTAGFDWTETRIVGLADNTLGGTELHAALTHLSKGMWPGGDRWKPWNYVMLEHDDQYYLVEKVVHGGLRVYSLTGLPIQMMKWLQAGGDPAAVIIKKPGRLGPGLPEL